MKTRYPHLIVLGMFAVGALPQCAAQSLLQERFDFVLEGDDPSRLFNFDLPQDPLIPSVLRFDGLFQNLDPSATGVRYAIWWTSPQSGEHNLDWTPLPAGGELPVHYEQLIQFTPDAVTLLVEGGGPADHFRFTGDFSVQQVPEPGMFALFATAAAIGAVCLRRNK